MLTIFCIWWIGTQLQAPAWFYVALAISAFIKLISYGIDMYKKGKESRD